METELATLPTQETEASSDAAIPAAPAGSAEAQPTEAESPAAEPPSSEGEAETKLSYEDWRKRVDDDPDLAAEHETRERASRKEVQTETWKRLQSAIQPAQDELRQVLQESSRQVAAIEKNLRDAVAAGDLEPEQVAPYLASINAGASWAGFQGALNVIGQAIGDESLEMEFWGRKYQELRRQSADRTYRDDTWASDLVSRIAENMPEDVIQRAVKENPHLQSYVAKAKKEAYEAGAKTARANVTEEVKAEFRSKNGPDNVRANAGSRRYSEMTFEERSKLSPSERDALAAQEMR